MRTLKTGTGFSSMQAVENQMLQLEAGLPEGAQMQIHINVQRVYVPFYGMRSPAQYFASEINGYIKSHPATTSVQGETIKPWSSGTPIAVGDDTTSTITLRWRKGQPFVAAILGVLRVIAPWVIGAAIAYVLVHLIQSWVFGTNASGTSAGHPGILPSPSSLRTFAVVGGALLFGPLILRDVRGLVKNGRQLEKTVRR